MAREISSNGFKYIRKDVHGFVVLGGIQQLRGQEEGERGQPKVHACPPRAHCFHMEVKVAFLNANSQNYNFFEVKLVPYASLCLENYLD